MRKKILWIFGAIATVVALMVAFIMDQSDVARPMVEKHIKLEYPANNTEGFTIADGVVLRTFRIDGGPCFLKNTISNQSEMVECSTVYYSIKNNSNSNFHWNGFAKIYPIKDEVGKTYDQKEIGRYLGYDGENFQNSTANIPAGGILQGALTFEPIPEKKTCFFLEFDLLPY